MGRSTRFAPAGVTFHVVNRGNDCRVIFRRAADYERFFELLHVACRKFPVKLFGLCAMPTHFHLLLRPEREGALSAYMQWVTGCYACELRARTETVGHGHVFQRRFWNAAMRDDEHFLTVLRYIEANPIRKHLVERAENWRWSSLGERGRGSERILSPLPVALPSSWTELVNRHQRKDTLNQIRSEIIRKPGRPPRR